MAPSQGSELMESTGPGGRETDNYVPATLHVSPCHTAYSGREAGKTGSYIGIHAVCTFGKYFVCPSL